MLNEVFARGGERYRSLPLLGSYVDALISWMCEQHYTRVSCKWHVQRLPRIDDQLRKLGVEDVREVTSERLRSCKQALESRGQAKHTLGLVQRFLASQGLLATPAVEASQTDVPVVAYADYLRAVRGFGDGAVGIHSRSARRLLDYLEYEKNRSCLKALSHAKIEAFVRSAGRTLARSSLQEVVAQLRGFLRFLASRGEVSPELHLQIDSPRVYRWERPPRSLPWDVVRDLLNSIDRNQPTGLRDYTIFFLMATYGLRSSEVVSLTLDSIEWRSASLHILALKNREPLLLPLTDDAGAILLDYLRHGRPQCARRELFLRSCAPIRGLRPSAVGENFRAWIRRSGLNIAVQGPHCLRHSFAVHLLRRGTPLKTIGSILGHRLAESTCMYLGLNTEDLRGVALELPQVEESKS